MKEKTAAPQNGYFTQAKIHFVVRQPFSEKLSIFQ